MLDEQMLIGLCFVVSDGERSDEVCQWFDGGAMITVLYSEMQSVGKAFIDTNIYGTMANIGLTRTCPKVWAARFAGIGKLSRYPQGHLMVLV